MTRAARARGDRTLLVAVGEGVPLFTGLARPLNLRLITLDTPGLPLSTRLTVASLSPALSQSTQP